MSKPIINNILFLNTNILNKFDKRKEGKSETMEFFTIAARETAQELSKCQNFQALSNAMVTTFLHFNCDPQKISRYVKKK